MLTLFLILIGNYLSEGEVFHVWEDWGNYTYFISDKSHLNLKLTYIEASLYCQNMSLHLASVHSQEETEFLKDNKATMEETWFGLYHTQITVPTDCRCEGCPDTEEPPSPECENCVSCRGADKWRWEDGTQYDWTNWQSEQPTSYESITNREELCARFHGDGKWYDDVCSKKFYFICKNGENRTSTGTSTLISTDSSTSTSSTAGVLSSTSTEDLPAVPTASPHGSGKDNNMSAIIGGVVAAAILLIIVVVGFVILWKWKNQKKKALHDYINTGPYAEEKVPQGGKSVPVGNGISADYADADVEDINFYAASDVAKKSEDDNQYSVEMQNDLYDRSGNQPEVEDGLPVYAEVDKDQKKKNRNKPTKPPRTNKKKKGQAPPPPVNDQGGAVYAVPDKGKKAQKKEGSGQAVQGETNLAMLYAEPKKKSKQNVGQPVVSSAAPEEVEYEDVQKKETGGKLQPMPKPKKK